MKIESGKWKINYVRDGLVEESHQGVFSFNDTECSKTPYYLRSCAKPLQATLLIDYGIDLTDEELALCCGSHAGEECHIRIAKNLLNKLGISETNLKCGVHAPLSRTMQDKMLLNGEKPAQIHNNCSGKHIGFLAICKKMGWDMQSYDSPSHPLQIAVKNKINSMCKIESNYPMTTDGCGVPILSMPLYNMAQGFVNLLKYPQIVSAIKNNPYIFGGENRTDTEIIQKSDKLIAKVGAGGLCVVLNICEKKAFALKIDDCSMDARRIAIFEILKKLSWAEIEYDDKIRTLSGKEVGKIVFEFA
ncbi:asparaginase [bacterium]|nr:asparaginase [bacterium]